METFVTYNPIEATEVLIKTGATLAAQQEIESLRQQLAECERDAKRYRYMRQLKNYILRTPDEKLVTYRNDSTPEELDTAIDAALAKLGADKGEK